MALDKGLTLISEGWCHSEALPIESGFTSFSLSISAGPEMLAQFLVLLWRGGRHLPRRGKSSLESSPGITSIHSYHVVREEGFIEKALLSATHSPDPRNTQSQLRVASMALLLICLITLITGEPWNNTFLAMHLKWQYIGFDVVKMKSAFTKTPWARRLIIFVQPFFLTDS